MCGILGIVDLDGAPSEGRIREVAATMYRRGPDDTGSWSNGMVALGHRRLSILDLSSAGRNPMCGPSGDTKVVYNGELYDFRERRAELESGGASFSTGTDTEVLLCLYDRYGLNFLERLRGMYAFGLWDEERRRLVLARDPFGQKPLFYHQAPRRLVFASQFDTLLDFLGIGRDVSPEALDSFLSLGYVPAPNTIYGDVRKLPAGHRMVVEPGRDTLQVNGPESFFELDVNPNYHRSRSETVMEARTRLKEAIRLRLVADVPVGAFLSGGVDSSAIVAIMSEAFKHSVKTFSVGFSKQRYDELEYARRIARKFGTDHYEVVLTPERVAGAVDETVAALGEPFADPSALNNFFVSQLASEHVKVSLAGDGGDEAFAGYNRYTREATRNPLASLPMGVRRMAALAMRFVPEIVASRSGQVRRFQHGVQRTGREDLGRYLARLFVFSRRERQSLYRRHFYERVHRHDALDGFPSCTPPRTDDEILLYQWADLRSYIPEDLMLKADRTSMWHSLEVRAPFLDPELVRFAMTIPSNMNVKGPDARKSVLKEALSGMVPDEVMHRKKLGFALPYGEWMRGPWKGWVAETLLDPDSWIYKWLEPSYASRLLENQRNGQVGADWRVWSLVMLEKWARQSNL